MPLPDGCFLPVRGARAGLRGLWVQLPCTWEGGVGVRFSWLGLAALGAVSLSLAACKPKPGEGAVDDEAALANFAADRFHHAGLHNGVDYFHDMDGAIPLTETEAQGRAM